jgi:hypothetical protein
VRRLGRPAEQTVKHRRLKLKGMVLSLFPCTSCPSVPIPYSVAYNIHSQVPMTLPSATLYETQARALVLHFNSTCLNLLQRRIRLLQAPGLDCTSSEPLPVAWAQICTGSRGRGWRLFTVRLPVLLICVSGSVPNVAKDIVHADGFGLHSEHRRHT